MAKLGSSSSCRPLLQARMMLLALLLLASIQAALVMAASLEQGLIDLGEKGKEFVGQVGEKGKEFVGGEKALDQVGEKGTETAVNEFLTEVGKINKVLKDLTDGAKKGIKVHKYWCKAQGLMDKLNPGGSPYLVEIVATSGNGGDALSMRFPAPCWSFDQQQVPTVAAGTTLVPSMYPANYVRITGIRVGQVELPVRIPAAPAAYLVEETSLYVNLRDAVVGQMKVLYPRATPTVSTTPTGADDKLCYAAAALSPPLQLPGIAILLASDNPAMPTRVLVGGATDTAWVWYPRSSMICLGIWRTVEVLIHS